MMRARTRKLAVDVIEFLNGLPWHKSLRVIEFQLEHVGDYRAACRARSQAEFFSKLSIVIEEADETEFWLGLIEDLKIDQSPRLKYLQQETLEILKICAKARKSM
ncbi:MAG TPA: four helix bundle protein [Saprospiraceae bacterium]|nr:four helix bundle protein [Saprospiraceae bacterium]